ncbi:MAG: hypothetical protein PHT76_12485 [Anaerostipes sp.]|nr:hypothetical protein [Anaerostipes sp.]
MSTSDFKYIEEMSINDFNQYIEELLDYWEGKNDSFIPLPISEEVDLEMEKDSFY